MAIDFPDSPTPGQEFQGYYWDDSKQAWRSQSTNRGSVITSATTPTGATAGDLWFNTVDGTMYVYYDDGITTQWVEIQANVDNYKTPSQNYIINSAFDIWQRGTSTIQKPAGYYTADRWATWINSGSGTIQQDTTNVPAFLQYGIRYTSGGDEGSCVFYHTIETLNAELLAGKTVNLSAYLSGTAGKNIQVSLWSSTTTDNVFTGSWTLVGATAYANTTSVSRVSASYVIPANAKTIQVRFYNLSKLANAEFFSFTGVQLEEGTIATPFRRNQPNIQAELAACMRYYYQFARQTAAGVTSALPIAWTPTASSAEIYLHLPEMRSAPVLDSSAANTFVEQRTGAVPSAISLGTGGWVPGRMAVIVFSLSSMVAGGAGNLRTNAVGAFLALNSEL